MARTSSLLQTYRLRDSLTRDVVNEFTKDIHKNRFFNNKYYLKQSSALIKFDRKSWHLRPDCFANDYYGSADMFHIILLVNDIFTRFNFRAEVLENGIYAPSVESIQNVLSQDIR